MSLLDASTQAERSLYVLGFRFRNKYIHTSTKQDPPLSKYGLSYFQGTRPEWEIESFFTTGKQIKIDCFSVDGFSSPCNTVFEAMGCFYHFCPCHELRPSLTEEDIQRGSKKRELDALRRHYAQEKGFKVIEIWECERWTVYKTTNTVKQHIREHFPYRRSLAAEHVLEEIKKEKLSGYMHCYFEVPEILRLKIENSPAIFKNTLVSKKDIVDLMKTYAAEEGILYQPRKCWYQASHYKMEHLLLLCCYFNYTWVLFAQNYTALLTTLQKNA